MERQLEPTLRMVLPPKLIRSLMRMMVKDNNAAEEVLAEKQEISQPG